jgi:hypothetical protein
MMETGSIAYYFIFFMLLTRLATNFCKVKHLRAVAVSTNKGTKFVSSTDNTSFEITNPLEGILGVLAAC